MFNFCRKTSILSASGSLVAEGTLIVNIKSTRLSLNQAKSLFQEANGEYYQISGCLVDSLSYMSFSHLCVSFLFPFIPAVKINDMFDMHACVHEGQLHMKLVQVDPATAAANVNSAAPKKASRQRASGAENVPENMEAADATTSAPAFVFGAQNDPSAPAAAANTMAARAKRAAPKAKKVSNKRISGSITTSEVKIYSYLLLVY